jgi:hypothetical protein
MVSGKHEFREKRPKGGRALRLHVNEITLTCVVKACGISKLKNAPVKCVYCVKNYAVCNRVPFRITLNREVTYTCGISAFNKTNMAGMSTDETQRPLTSDPDHFCADSQLCCKPYQHRSIRALKPLRGFHKILHRRASLSMFISV